MKIKMILAAVGLATALTAAAQGQGQGNGRQGNMRGNMDAVVDTAIINTLNVPADTKAKVLDLQKTKQAQMREMMKKQSRPEKGQRLTDEQRKQMQADRAAFTKQYRAELRTILGDAAYIEYLEKQIDRRPMGGGMGNGQRNNANRRPQMPQIPQE